MRYAVLLFLFGLAGCADNRAARVAYLNRMVGQSEPDLIRSLGVPTRTYDTAGRRFVAYDESRLDVIPGGPFFGGGYYGRGFGYGFGGLGAFPTEVVERGCETTFEIGAGRVQSWTLRGNACG